jgi:hypothetical protein
MENLGSTTYATFHAGKATSRHNNLPMLRAGKFTFFFEPVNLSAKRLAP